MRRFLLIGCVAGAVLSVPALAQLDAPAADTQQRIVPENQDPKDRDILSTRKQPAETPPAAPLPWQKQEPVAAPANAAKPAAAPFGTYQGKSPFAHAEPAGPVVPSGPHTTVAVPVGDVDAVEASEAAPPTPVANQADPAKEDPADPTELTSPIFEPGDSVNGPRKLVLRVLNKVTGQSQMVTLKPTENVIIGQLQITAVACQASALRSQTDYAGLIDIAEQRPGEKGLKELFRGWMYASSPSITALEHPVYDVTVVECVIKQPDAKKEAETEGKADKKADKKGKK